MRSGRVGVASWVATAWFAITAIAAAIDPDAFLAVAFASALVLTVAGCAWFVAAYAAGVQRSRTHELGIGGWFFLAGSAPRRVQVELLGAFGVQCVVALATASVRPFTALAFGTLVPILGLAACGWWGARSGTFAPRHDPARR